MESVAHVHVAIVVVVRVMSYELLLQSTVRARTVAAPAATSSVINTCE